MIKKDKGVSKQDTQKYVRTKRIKYHCSIEKKERIWFEFRGIRKSPYINLLDLEDGMCAICYDKKGTHAHHVIPKRSKCKNGVLADLRIRICKDCDKLVHGEHDTIDGMHIIKKQAKSLSIFEKEKKELINILSEFINKRIESLKKDFPRIIEEFKDNPKKIHPAHKLVEGRIKELRYFRQRIKNSTKFKYYRGLI